MMTMKALAVSSHKNANMLSFYIDLERYLTLVASLKMPLSIYSLFYK